MRPIWHKKHFLVETEAKKATAIKKRSKVIKLGCDKRKIWTRQRSSQSGRGKALAESKLRQRASQWLSLKDFSALQPSNLHESLQRASNERIFHESRSLSVFLVRHYEYIRWTLKHMCTHTTRLNSTRLENIFPSSNGEFFHWRQAEEKQNLFVIQIHPRRAASGKPLWMPESTWCPTAGSGTKVIQLGSACWWNPARKTSI